MNIVISFLERAEAQKAVWEAFMLARKPFVYIPGSSSEPNRLVVDERTAVRITQRLSYDNWEEASPSLDSYLPPKAPAQEGEETK